MTYRIPPALHRLALVIAAACFFFGLAASVAETPGQLVKDQSANSTMVRPEIKKADPKIQAAVNESYGKLPLSFEASQGQTGDSVKFLSRGDGYALFLTPTEAIISLKKKSEAAERASVPGRHQDAVNSAGGSSGKVVRMHLIGANPSPKMAGLDELSGKSNYLIGADPAKWRTNVRNYSKVKIDAVYPGIDLVYYGNQRQLEYDWIISPGADPAYIRFKVEGSDSLRIDAQGGLALDQSGEVRLNKPVIYQERGGRRIEVAGGYAFKGRREVGFNVDKYDASLPLVIDPVLVYSTYLGGRSVDRAYGIAVDDSGSAYITGFTESTNFPRANEFQGGLAGNSDVFILKLNPAGNALMYSTYLGGSGIDEGHGIAVDAAGNAFVTGMTVSTNFPTAYQYQATYNGMGDAFVAKLNSAGNALVYSTYLGGGDQDCGESIAVNASGNAYVVGYTGSTNFPTANAIQSNRGGQLDAFITKLNLTGSALAFSTYLGGGSNDYGYGIAVDVSGNAYITGQTGSINFPTANPFQAVNNSALDAFVSKINIGGNLAYSTYLGGGSEDRGYGIAVDFNGNAYVTGSTVSTNFPTANAFQAYGGNGDAFVAKFNPAGNSLAYSTYLGGSYLEYAYGIAVDATGSAYITGATTSSNFPIANPIQSNYEDREDAFVTKLNPSGNALVYSTYLGANQRGQGIAVDFAGNAYIAGYTDGNFPIVNPFQSYVFVAKIGGTAPPLLQITMNRTTYVNYDAVVATEFRLQNLALAPALCELKVWLGIPGLDPIGILNLGSDGSLTLPSSINADLGPLNLFQVGADFPRGIYEFSSRMTSPVTSKFLSEDINKFVIQ